MIKDEEIYQKEEKKEEEEKKLKCFQSMSEKHLIEFNTRCS